MDYLKNIEAGGFIVVRRKTTPPMPVKLLERYPDIPPEYLDFLTRLDQITNRDDTAWFTSVGDFNGESDSDFTWDEFETISLEAADGDEEEIEQVRNFWDRHIPVLMSVDEYEYLAICLNSENYGEIVHGQEPEFEETTKVCDNFGQLLKLMQTPQDNHYLKRFL